MKESRARREKRQPIPSGLAGRLRGRRAFRFGFPFCFSISSSVATCARIRRSVATPLVYIRAHVAISQGNRRSPESHLKVTFPFVLFSVGFARFVCPGVCLASALARAGGGGRCGVSHTVSYSADLYISQAHALLPLEKLYKLLQFDQDKFCIFI